MILRVDRADLSKNVLRGFSAFDIFLEQHPEYSERVTFVAQLMPSRTDVTEYHGVPRAHRGARGGRQPPPRHARLDADPAQAARRPRGGLRLLQALRRAARQRDVRRHEPRRQGGPAAERERDGVSILSENTGAHDELGEFALSVNPFDIQELADSIHAALDDGPAERARRARRAAGDRDARAIRATGSTSSWRTSGASVRLSPRTERRGSPGREARRGAPRPGAGKRLRCIGRSLARRLLQSAAARRPRRSARGPGASIARWHPRTTSFCCSTWLRRG